MWPIGRETLSGYLLSIPDADLATTLRNDTTTLELSIGNYQFSGELKKGNLIGAPVLFSEIEQSAVTRGERLTGHFYATFKQINPELEYYVRAQLKSRIYRIESIDWKLN